MGERQAACQRGALAGVSEVGSGVEEIGYLEHHGYESHKLVD